MAGASGDEIVRRYRRHVLVGHNLVVQLGEHDADESEAGLRRASCFRVALTEGDLRRLPLHLLHLSSRETLSCSGLSHALGNAYSPPGALEGIPTCVNVFFLQRDDASEENRC